MERPLRVVLQNTRTGSFRAMPGIHRGWSPLTGAQHFPSVEAAMSGLDAKYRAEVRPLYLYLHEEPIEDEDDPV